MLRLALIKLQISMNLTQVCEGRRKCMGRSLQRVWLLYNSSSLVAGVEEGIKGGRQRAMNRPSWRHCLGVCTTRQNRVLVGF